MCQHTLAGVRFSTNDIAVPAIEVLALSSIRDDLLNVHP
jgi:hypothetical protein